MIRSQFAQLEKQIEVHALLVWLFSVAQLCATSALWKVDFNFNGSTNSLLKNQNISALIWRLVFSTQHLFTQESNTDKVDDYLKNYTSNRPPGVNTALVAPLSKTKLVCPEASLRMLA